MWTEFKPEQPYVAFDLSALIDSVLKKADNALKDASEAQNVDLELLAKVRALKPEVEPDH